jgi:hypothetical protein
VVTLECVEKLIRKDMVDPVNGDKLTERDIIVLQRVSLPSPILPLPSSLTLLSRAPPPLPNPSLPRDSAPSRPRPILPSLRSAPPLAIHSTNRYGMVTATWSPALNPGPSPLSSASSGWHRLRGLRGEAAGRDVAPSDAGLSSCGDPINRLGVSGRVASSFEAGFPGD